MSRESSDNRSSTRRNFLGTGLALTATSLIAGSTTPDNSGAGTPSGHAALPAGAAAPVGRRRLGRLEVSAVGIASRT